MKSQSRSAITGPRSLREPTSQEYAIQTMRSLKRYLESKSIDAKGVERELQEIIQYKHWEACGHKNLDAYLRAEIGSTHRQLQQRLAQDLAADPSVTAMRADGGDRRSKDFQPDNISLKHGTSAAYLVRRLKRDAPKIAEALAQGEFKSARAAAIAAGIIAPAKPLDQVRKLWKKLSPAERDEVKGWPSAE